MVRLRKLDGIEVSPLDIFHQGRLQRFPVGKLLYDGGDRRNTRTLGGTKPSLPRDEFVPGGRGTNEDGLQNPFLPHGLDQVPQLSRGKRSSGLLGPGPDFVHRDVQENGLPFGRAREKGRQASSKNLLFQRIGFSLHRFTISLASSRYDAAPRELTAYRIAGFPKDGDSESRTLRCITV